MSSESPRELAPGMYWLEECGPDRSHFLDGRTPSWITPEQEMHIPQNAYLVRDDRSLLFDTLSPASTDRILTDLELLLEGESLDYLVVSHPDVPHAGNTLPILEAHPEATLVAPGYGTGHELYHLEDAMHVTEGDEIDLGEYTVAFHEATFPDAAVHVWMSETKTGTLFPVDWFGYPHTSAECSRFADEFEHPLTVDRLVEYHGRVLFWFQYVDVPTVHEAIDEVIARIEPSIIAPGHGNVIREDVDEAVAMAKEAVEHVRTGGRVGTLG